MLRKGVVPVTTTPRGSSNFWSISRARGQKRKKAGQWGKGTHKSTGRFPKMCIDGNYAAAHCAYAMSDTALVYPITPSTGIAQQVESWASEERPNVISGLPVVVRQMQSEAGVAGALHGALQAGALASTYTSSQGLLLMVPVLYKIAGEGLPLVVHLGARAVSANGVTIYSDHSDVYGIRNTGVSLLSSHSVQEAMDLGLAAHIAAIESSTPVVHFFEGMQVSHEIAPCRVIPYAEMKSIVPRKAIAEFRARALSPAHPRSIGVVLGRETFWQQAASDGPRIRAVPDRVQAAMDAVAKLTGNARHTLFEYAGAPNAERVVVAMGAHAQTVELAARDLWTRRGERVGVVKVHLFRPWDAERFLAALPKTVKRVAVLDRGHEATAVGDPLFLDVTASLAGAGRLGDVSVVGGQYAIGDHTFTVQMAKSVFGELERPNPRKRFTVGLVDDVNKQGIPIIQEDDVKDRDNDKDRKDVLQCVFWGIGGDGTISANKNATKIVASTTKGATDVQAIFQYDAHKTGGVTVSHLRFLPGDRSEGENALPLYHGEIGPGEADFVACHVARYLQNLDVVQALKRGGTLLVNCPCGSGDNDAEKYLEEYLPAHVRPQIAAKEVRLYAIDASRIAREAGIGKYTSSVLSAAFFKVARPGGIAPEIAAQKLKDAAAAGYGKRSADELSAVIAANARAIDQGMSAVREVLYPRAEWAKTPKPPKGPETHKVPDHVKDIVNPICKLEGMSIPVSAFLKHSEHGLTQPGSAGFEKRGVSMETPIWDPSKCVQCNRCAFACPHAVVRPFLIRKGSTLLNKGGEKGMATTPSRTAPDCMLRIQASPLDCTGCGACVKACPTGALRMGARTTADTARWDALRNNTDGSVRVVAPSAGASANAGTVPYVQPLMEFAGACAGCPEPTYSKLLTQLFGDNIIIANGIGCSTVWGGTAFCNPYTTGRDGRGPAWGCSLFEDNAEYGYGMLLGYKARRRALRIKVAAALAASSKKSATSLGPEVREALQRWLRTWDEATPAAKVAADYAVEALTREAAQGKGKALARKLLEDKDIFRKHHFWIVGGDGWAHDIGFGGLDHILASEETVRVLVLDNENYANTGGQRSKATPAGSIAKLASRGKRTGKKDLGSYALAMHPAAYVASVCYGANFNQTVRALREADAHRGPALVVSYCPCAEHKPKGSFSGAVALERMKLAVDAGYWPLYRRIPGKGITFDSRTKPGLLGKFLESEGRFAALKRNTNPQFAATLRHHLEADIAYRDRILKTLSTVTEF